MQVAYMPSENVLPRTRVLSPYEARLFPRFPNRSTTFQPDIYCIARGARLSRHKKKREEREWDNGTKGTHQCRFRNRYYIII